MYIYIHICFDNHILSLFLNINTFLLVNIDDKLIMVFCPPQTKFG